MNPRDAFRIATLAVISGLGLVALISLPAPASACRVPAAETRYTMEVLVDGSPLPKYSSSGTSYVEAQKGREYAIRLTNRTAGRVAVALAVDGLNSIDARHTSSSDARKWILAPWESITLSGWQTGSDTARRFVFTSESKSYGSWLGRTSDLGVISAAFFREARRMDRIAPSFSSPAPRPQAPSENESDSRADAGAARESSGGELQKSAKAKDELAATGIGREIEHQVIQVEFEEEAAPAAIASVRYEYHDALVRLGVLPRGDDALARRERARGFSDSGFAPDPYRDRR